MEGPLNDNSNFMFTIEKLKFRLFFWAQNGLLRGLRGDVEKVLGVRIKDNVDGLVKSRKSQLAAL
jgi:hypothetical protein